MMKGQVHLLAILLKRQPHRSSLSVPVDLHADETHISHSGPVDQPGQAAQPEEITKGRHGSSSYSPCIGWDEGIGVGHGRELLERELLENRKGARNGPSAHAATGRAHQGLYLPHFPGSQRDRSVL